MHWHFFFAIISEVTSVRKERDRRKRKVRKCESGKGMKMGLKMHELNVTWATRAAWTATWAKWPELNVTRVTQAAHELNELNDMSAGWGAFSWAGCSTASSRGEARRRRHRTRQTSTGTQPTRSSPRFFYFPSTICEAQQPSYLTDFELDALFPFCLSVIPLTLPPHRPSHKYHYVGGGGAWGEWRQPSLAVRSGHDYYNLGANCRTLLDDTKNHFDYFGCDVCLDPGQPYVMMIRFISYVQVIVD